MTNKDAIKWLGNLRNDLGNPHYECLWPYAQAIDEICELLEEQEPRVMTLEEVEDALDTVVWVDRPDMENTSEAYARISAYSRVNKEIWLRYAFIEKPRTKVEAYGDYGITYRCWTARPTDAQREAHRGNSQEKLLLVSPRTRYGSIH